MRERKTMKISTRIFLVVFLILVVIASFFWFQRAVNGTVSESSTNFLKETASLYAGTFQVKLNDQLFMLESQARYFADVNMDDYNIVKETIMSTKGVGEFKRIAVANTSGMTINYDGKSSGNILMKDYFQKAMQGQAQISSTISTDEDGERVLTLAVPIFQNEKVVGVITGTFAYRILDDLFSVDTFDGEGYSYIIDKSGAVIVGSKSPSRLCFVDNVFKFYEENRALTSDQLAAMKSDIAMNLTNVITYSVNDENRITVYTPVGLNDWYVFSALTSEYILSQQHRITKITLTLVVIMFGVFAIFMTILTNLLVHNARVEKDNSRYAITTENSQTLIFEYDFEHKTIEFTGNSTFLFGANLKQIPLSSFDMIKGRIHEDENDILERLSEFVKLGESNYSSEFRLKDGDDYSWYRISASLVFDKEEKPLKFIGNLVNVNAQVIHEQELKTIAETDSLSGLLNKGAMEKNVTRSIQESNGELFGAFFIIDLDNFKQVNDRLGHSFGDMAITDTASKLSLVFSEKDFIGRIGGDEFCVFLCIKNGAPNAKKIVEDKANTLRGILAEIYSDGNESVQVTPSIGITFFPEQATAYKELFKQADIALYHVKNHGKNNFAIYTPSMGNKGESVYEN